ncbi:MAG: hypothetical protein HZB40_04710 [Rhodocyclales bacterium]|nr:hypothetical protein [Rhodocyclales bacterium]
MKNGFDADLSGSPKLESRGRLESISDMATVGRFMLRTPDGLVASALVLGYWGLFLTIAILNIPLPLERVTRYEALIATALMPMLLLAVFVRHRIGTEIADSGPVLYSIIGLMVLALAPIVVVFSK